MRELGERRLALLLPLGSLGGAVPPVAVAARDAHLVKVVAANDSLAALDGAIARRDGLERERGLRRGGPVALFRGAANVGEGAREGGRGRVEGREGERACKFGGGAEETGVDLRGPHVGLEWLVGQLRSRRGGGLFRAR